MIVIRLDRMLADRKMRLNDLAAQVGISNVNLSYLKTGKVKAVRDRKSTRLNSSHS